MNYLKLALFIIVIPAIAKEEFWNTFDSGKYDFKFAYYEELDQTGETADDVAKNLEINEMKKRAAELQNKIKKDSTVLQDIKSPTIENEKEEQEKEFAQNVPLDEKDFEIRKEEDRKFSYDPIVQYKEKIENANFTDKKRNYFLPWEQKYRSLIADGLKASANYSFGSVSENNNASNIKTEKQAQIGFNVEWVKLVKLENEFSLVLSSNLNYTYISAATTNIELDNDFRVFEKVYFPTLRFSYTTPFVEFGYNRFSHISSISNSAVFQSHISSGLFAGLGMNFRVPIRNTIIAIEGSLKRHLAYTSVPQTFGSDITGFSGWELEISPEWFINNTVYLDFNLSTMSLTNSQAMKISIAKTYAGVGIRF